MRPIILDDIDEPEVWGLVRWMVERSSDWVLIGGLMVATFDLEYGDLWRQTDDVFLLPRPNLLGAILVKAAASRYASRPKDHRDLAHLVAKVEDPIEL